MKILYTVIFLLFANILFAQYPVGDPRWNKVTGKNYITDSSASLKLRNNYTEDSIPVTDMYGVWKMKRFFADSARVTNITNIIDSSKTVNNYLSGIDSSSTRLLSGSVIWDSNFVFHNTLLKYLILGRQFSAAANTVILNAADPTYDRYTVIYADTLGNVGSIDGVAGAFSTVPNVDPTSQILLGIYYIPHASTKPAFVSNTTIYKENIEWVLSGTATGLDGNYLVAPYQGLKSTLVPVIITGQYLTYTNATALTASDYGYLIFYLKLGATFSTSTHLVLSFQNGGSPVSTTLSLASGSFGFDRTAVGSWRLVAVPMGAIAFSSQNFNQLKIGLTGSNGSGFQIDNIILQAGNIPPNPTGTVVTSFNNRTNNVLPLRIDYKDYIDSLSIDSTGKFILGWNNGIVIRQTQYNAGPDTTLFDAVHLIVVKKGTLGGGFPTNDSVTYVSTTTSSQWRDTTGSAIYYPLGSVGIGNILPNASAKLDVSSTTKGVLLPRLTTAQQNAIATPATGLQIFNTDLVSFMFYNGTAWVAVGGGGGGGGVTGSGVATRIPFWNGASSLTSDTSFRYSPIGSLTSIKSYAGLVVKPVLASVANSDTLFALEIRPIYNVGANTGVVKRAIKINQRFINADSIYNFSFGDGTSAQPTTGHTNFFGVNAGSGATSAHNSNFFGQGAGIGATSAAVSNFFGPFTGQNATGAQNSNFMGESAGDGATNASFSNFFGPFTGQNATGAQNSNFFGYSAGTGATGASYSNFFGNRAGYGATGAYYSNFYGNGAGNGATSAHDANFFGFNAGIGATSAAVSNFFGFRAGYLSTNANSSNFYGEQAGDSAVSANNSNFFGAFSGHRATSASNSNFYGNRAGTGATGASYSNFFGYHVGDSTTYKITGSNNILIGTNITTPSASSANTMNLGGVLFGTNFYSTPSGGASNAASTTGQIGINVTTPATSSVLDVTSTTKGILIPRVTTTQRDAIASPATLLQVSNTTTNSNDTYDGVSWKRDATWGYIATAGTYTALSTDYTINCTSGTFVVTLPTAVGLQGRVYIVKNSGAGVITMAGNTAQTFDGVTSPTIAAGAVAQYQSNNANWIKIN